MDNIENIGASFGSGTKKRLPICFCLDASGSMSGVRIKKLNEAMQVFVETIQSNNDAMASADIAIITYGGSVKIDRPFAPLTNGSIPIIEARYRTFTPMGAGILNALELLEIRKQGYKNKGLKYYQPWLVLITDGKPEGPNAGEEIEKAIARLNEVEANNKIVVFNIGVDSEADLTVLKRLSVKRKEPIFVESTNLASLFEFLGSSSSSIVKGGSVDTLYSVPEVFNDTDQDFNMTDMNQDSSADDDFDINKWLND